MVNFFTLKILFIIMSQQIRLAADKKKELNLKDIENIHQKIDNTYEAPVSSTKDAINSKKKELQSSIDKVCELHQRGMQLKSDLDFYKNKMTSIIEKNRQIHEQAEYQKKQIAIAKQKLLIFNTLNEISKLQKEIQNNYQKSNISPSFVDTFEAFKAKTSLLKLGNLYEDIFNQCQSYFKKDINKYFSPDETSFSFKIITEKSKILRFFELIPIFIDSFWKYINSTFLPYLSKSNCSLTISEEKISFKIEGSEKNNPVYFIKSSSTLLKAIKEKFSELKIDISDEELAKYANKAIEIGLSLQGGPVQYLNDETAQLCQLANIPPVNLAKVMKEARLPVALDRCRDLLKEGKPFGTVISEMRQIMEGTNTDGVLKQITVMATHFWKDDKQKLQIAINPLISIGTAEALECIMMLDSAIH